MIYVIIETVPDYFLLFLPQCTICGVRMVAMSNKCCDINAFVNTDLKVNLVEMGDFKFQYTLFKNVPHDRKNSITRRKYLFLTQW